MENCTLLEQEVIDQLGLVSADAEAMRQWQ